MADAIVGPLLSKLQEVAVTEGKALAAVGNEIDRLRNKLMWLHLLVHENDLCSRTDDNQRTRLLACQVREVAFAAEDAIDHFFLEVDLSRFGYNGCWAAAMFFSNFGTQIRFRYILSRKVKSMNAQLEDIFDNNAKYGSSNGSTEAITWKASGATSQVRQNWDYTYSVENPSEQGTEIRKEHEERLTTLLLDENESRVIYVVGESGMGKRYLAKKAYENETIKHNFEVRVWASFPPDSSNITDEVKRKLEEKCSKLQPSRKNLDQVRYLVVVDCPMSSTMLGDNIIAQNLLKGGEGSKILLTVMSSPLESLHHASAKNVCIMELDYLFKDKSVTLFNRILGLGGRRQTLYKRSMIDTVRKIIEPITKGLPLAVVLLARLMRTMDYSKWEAASMYLQMTNQDDVLLKIVSMGIDDLPNDLKSCLLYTAGFPECSTIEAGQLVRLWVAEGFLTGKDPDEQGQRYLKEYIFRGLMHPTKKTADVVESVSIHDRVHQIIRSEAQRIGFMETHYGGYTPPAFSARRLALNNNKMPDKAKRLWKVRAVLAHAGHADDAQGSQEFKEGFRQLLNDSTFLRVVSLEGVNIGNKLPKQIGNMLHLQYLGVRCQTLTTVPHSIGNLKRLQTMDVRGTQVKILPKSFWSIKTLRHVLGNDDLHFPHSARHLMKTLSTEATDMD